MDIPTPRHPPGHQGLQGLPQHFRDEVLRAWNASPRKPASDVDVAVHTHVNHATVTPPLRRAVEKLLDMGSRRAQSRVLLRGVNTTAGDLLELCFSLSRLRQDHAVLLYGRHDPQFQDWRLSIAEGMQLKQNIMGYLPGFATPRVTVDVPFVGKRWIQQLADYDRVKGISYWTKNYRTGIEADDAEALTRRYEYCDPVYTLPPEGQDYWRRQLAGKTPAAA